MSPRMSNPAKLLPDAMNAIQSLIKATKQGGISEHTLELVHLRVSQINGCAPCLEFGVRKAREAGETEERLATVAVWREAPFFDDAERAALALAEAITRMADKEDAVPDELWQQATEHYDERAMAALLVQIATANVFNRLNVPVRQPVGSLG